VSNVNAEIYKFIENIGSKEQILNFLYNLNNEDFDPKKSTIYYSGPYWDNKEIIAIFETVLTGKWLVSGEKVNQFEKRFSAQFNHHSSVMVNSGSSANLVMIAALKRYFDWCDGDEIIVSTVGFPTTVAPIVQANLSPVFVDIEFNDLNFDLEEVESKITDKTRAIFISPVLGNPPDMDLLVELAQKYSIELVMDDCDSLGSRWNGKYLTDYAVASSCSFYPAHHITTGEGGMVSSNNNEIVKLARSFAWWGRDCYCVGAANLLQNGTCKKRFDRWLPDLDISIDHKYLFTNIGYNLKPLDLQGAVGTVQLEKFEEIHAKRRAYKEKIGSFFEAAIDGVRVINEHSKAEASWFGVPLICHDKKLKRKLVDHLEGNRIQTRNYFAGNILLHPGYSNLDNAMDYPNANRVLDQVFFVGCSPTYSSAMIDYIEEVVHSF